MDLDQIIASMTRMEKIDFCVGADGWHTQPYEKAGIRSLMLSDGPHGLRCQSEVKDRRQINVSKPATCFPCASLSACSFDTEGLKAIGEAIGEEARDQQVDVVLGPGVNIKRNPTCGRNFEYFSEDPLLAGKMASHFIQGVQSQGVGTSLKHFACNSQETDRMNGNSVVDERTLREIYLKPFEICIKEAQPETVMCCYNKVNGVHGSDSRTLLTDILRREWGFKGLVMTDWGAVNDRIAAAKAGCDLIMPGWHNYMRKAMKEALESGELKESELDQCVRNLLTLALKHAQNPTQTNCDYTAHHALAVKAAEESAVLLKNRDQVLPIRKEEICLLGYMANQPRFQGAGSSHVNATQTTSLHQLWPEVPYLAATDERGNCTVTSKQLGEFIEHRIPVIVAGLPECYESEGFDRQHMRLPQQTIQLIEEVCRRNERTVLVLISGSVVELPFEDQLAGLLYLGLAGQGGSEALANLLTGKANPCGKCAESWPLTYDQVISHADYPRFNALYREGIYVGYRYYDKANIAVRYPFGHGLSYSRFIYSDLQRTGNTLQFTLTNDSDVAGKEAVQLYIAPSRTVNQEVRRLAAFKKVALAGHESQTVCFEIDEQWFSYYQKGFKVIGDDYQIQIGSSSRDLRLSLSYTVLGETFDSAGLSGSWYDVPKGMASDEDFTKLMGGSLPLCKQHSKGSYDKDDTVSQMAKDSRFMAWLKKVIIRVISASFKGADENDSGKMMMITCAVNAPMRVVKMNAKGFISDGLMQFMIDCVNGHPLAAFSRRSDAKH